MTFGKKLFYMSVPLFTDIVALYCILLLFSGISDFGIMTFRFPVYILFAFIAAFINCLLSLKERPIVMVAMVNAAVAICTGIVLFNLSHNISGMIAYIYTSLVFLFPVLRSFYLSRHPITINLMQQYCEASIFGTGLFLFTQVGVFQPDGSANLICLITILLNLFTLSSLRIINAGRIKTNGISAVQSGFILSGLIFLLVVVTALIGLFLPTSKKTILYVLTSIKEFFLIILGLLNQFFLYFFSLFQTNNDVGVEFDSPAPIAISDDVESLTVAFSQNAIIILIVIACIIVIGLSLFLLYKFRKIRLRASVISSPVQKEKSDSPSFFSLLLSILRKMISKLFFLFTLLLHFDTYAGVFVRLEYRGKRCGIPRSSSQTPREYLMALSACVPEQDTTTRYAFSCIADQIDMYCFKAGYHPAAWKVPPKQIKAVLHATIPQRRNNKKNSKV